MKLKYIVFCSIFLILIAGCVKTPGKIDSRSQELTQENSELKEQISGLQSQISDLKIELDEVTKERDEYLKQLDEFYLTKVTGDIDLNYWDRDHIVRALGYYNEKFKSVVWQTYNYRRETEDFYWAFNSSLGFVKDPFFNLRRRDRDTELDFFHFRIERLDLTKNTTFAQETYDSYETDILRESQIDPDLNCFKQTSCRSINVIKCVKDGKDYYGWSEGSFLFTTRFDNRETLNAFEQFYCYPDPYASLL